MTLSLTQQEYPAPVPDNEPDWNESFLLAGFDGKNEIGFWMHCARWRRNHDLWREIFTIALPDGTVLANRGISNALASKEGPGATNYSIRVLEPGKRLSYHYRGGVQRVPAEDLARGLLVNGYMASLEMDLIFESVAPVWDLHVGSSSKNFLGAGHIEQLGRVTGTIKLGKEVYQIDAMGTRDKSMGPRKPRDLKRHHWTQGLFDNGIGFMVFDAEEGDGGFNLAVVTEGDKIFKAEVEIPFRIETIDQKNDPFTMKLHYDKGTLDIYCDIFPRCWYLSYTTPIDTYIGVHPVPEGNPLTLLEQNARWVLNDEIKGIGVLERTVPGTIAIEPD